MLIHPCDAALDEREWRAWLGEGRDFGQLVTSDTDGWPLVVPTHFVLQGEQQVLVHLARSNPMWAALQADSRVLLAVLDDYAYVPTGWRAAPDVPPEHGVPTSYYAAVQLRCRAEIVDDPVGKADLLRRQLEHFQPDRDFADISVDSEPYGRMLAGIRALRLHVVDVRAKYKFDDHKPARHRRDVARRLQQRALGRDRGAADQQLRRLQQSLQARGPA
ncbi:MAG: FMN-binding negative transcriptional regulator [Mycobacteriales bacterium]